MGANSKIQWCDHTFNPWMGCAKASEGCANCYAEALMDRRYGKVRWGQQGTRVRTSAALWRQPLKWNKRTWLECTMCGWRGDPNFDKHCGCIAPYKDVRQRVFCASLADVFEDRQELNAWRWDLWQLIGSTPNLDWLLLTKRPENVMKMAFINDETPFLPNNVWLGVTVENQKRANERIPVLQTIPAAVKFLSVEPMGSFVSLSEAVTPDQDAWDEINVMDDDQPEEFVEECEAECDWVNYGSDLVVNPAYREWKWRRRSVAGFKTLEHGAIDWVICGGESGPGARPMDPNWARQLRGECGQAGIPFFFKQWGEYAPVSQFGEASTFKHQPVKAAFEMMVRVGKGAAGRLLDGQEWNETPGREAKWKR